MIFGKLIAALDANREALDQHTRALAFNISPQMVHDHFAGYLSSAGDDLQRRIGVVRDITVKLGVKEIAELSYDQFHTALELLHADAP